jgi:hypothetical protein
LYGCKKDVINQKVMITLLKKRFYASPYMRVIVALFYGLINFTVLLNHTCCSAKEEPYGCHIENSSCHFPEESCAGTRPKIALNQNSADGKVSSRRQYCSACLYSLTSKLFRLNSAVFMASVDAVVETRVILHLNFTKQLEWFSSAPLRAPPILTS